ncbi:hypothetical protein EVAR_57155_1 [Eumeta japonica]|uniref:Uncharacterized protein n=1 Tax=Eumeta variegata TaxID=151549 RepID=A0A4C1YW23_EUMVA|nr:hypothetical protein EVAR_57155_1 [Eumeta japonica]
MRRNYHSSRSRAAPHARRRQQPVAVRTRASRNTNGRGRSESLESIRLVIPTRLTLTTSRSSKLTPNLMSTLSIRCIELSFFFFPEYLQSPNRYRAYPDRGYLAPI